MSELPIGPIVYKDDSNIRCRGFRIDDKIYCYQYYHGSHGSDRGWLEYGNWEEDLDWVANCIDFSEPGPLIAKKIFIWAIEHALHISSSRPLCQKPIYDMNRFLCKQCG